MTGWPEGAADFLQAIADTKLVLGYRSAQWSLGGPSLEDDMGGASAAQEEIGHTRQLFRLLEEQGHDRVWLEGDRTAEEFSNAACLDDSRATWAAHLCVAAPTDRAAWYLLDAIDHDDFSGLVEKIGQDEYFHLEYHDARLEALAAEDPGTVEAGFEDALPDVLAFLGPSTYDEADDPLLGTFTDRSVAAMRDALLDHYDALFEETAVSLDVVDRTWPDPVDWNGTRRRVNGGGLTAADLDTLTGARTKEFVIE